MKGGAKTGAQMPQGPALGVSSVLAWSRWLGQHGAGVAQEEHHVVAVRHSSSTPQKQETQSA